MDQRSQLMRLAVFGFPVTHSQSPVIHKMFANQLGMDIDYQAIESRPHEFDQKLHKLVTEGGKGCNVTVPLKRLAWDLATSRSASAERARAVNTLVFEKENERFGDNTDGRGLVRDLAKNLQCKLEGTTICIVGAGGATSGVLGDLLELSPNRLVIANRTVGKAQELAQSHQDLGEVEACTLEQLAGLNSFDLVINATSLGHAGRHPDLPASLFTPDGLCYDLNYGQAAEPLRDRCQINDIAYQDGLGMLVEQAALSFALWTGKHPETSAVLKSLRQP
jgi:shikimate dehydrogenase